MHQCDAYIEKGIQDATVSIHSTQGHHSHVNDCFDLEQAEYLVENFFCWKRLVGPCWFILARSIRFGDINRANSFSSLWIISNSQWASWGSQSLMWAWSIITISHSIIPRQMVTSRSLKMLHLGFVTAVAQMSIFCYIRPNGRCHCYWILLFQKSDEPGWEPDFPFCMWREPPNLAISVVLRRMTAPNFWLRHTINNRMFQSDARKSISSTAM